MRCLIQFPAGLQSLVEQALAADLRGVEVRYSDESAIVVDSVGKLESGDDIPYAKNVFVVHAETVRRALPVALGALMESLPDLRRRRSVKADGFRLMFHIDGKLISVDARSRGGMERAVGRATGLRLTPRGNCQEFWVIGRRDSRTIYFAERLPATPSPARARGALSAELSALLVAASEPDAGDVFMDPFAGSGALVQARLRTPAREVIYNDIELKTHRSAFAQALNGRRVVRFLSEDALALPSVEAGSVDVIVTDPPWGEHDERVADYREFAAAMSNSFARVLRPGAGRSVILVNRRNEDVAADALTNAAMRIFDDYRILVNGHPATVIRVHG